MHAYLIIAHDQFDLLESLLKCIDDERNDIYYYYRFPFVISAGSKAFCKLPR